MANPRAIVSWEERDVHFFVFQLHPWEDARAGEDAPLAVFAMQPPSILPVAAVVVTANGTGEQAEVMNLLHPDDMFTVEIPESSMST